MHRAPTPTAARADGRDRPLSGSARDPALVDARCGPRWISTGRRATIAIDCDVFEAAVGRRTASVRGWIALALRSRPCGTAGARDPRAAGARRRGERRPRRGRLLLDLDYAEDSTARVDLNLVATNGARTSRSRAPPRRATPARSLDAMTDLALRGVSELCRHQREALAGAGSALGR
jgi:ribonuclease PH